MTFINDPFHFQAILIQDKQIFNDYDVNFLKENCAVLDGCGRIEDLYIAMVDDTITWAELRELEPFLPGLESAWSLDTFLDEPRSNTPPQASQCEPSEATTTGKTRGDNILPSGSSWISSSANLKRNASRISRTPSFGSTIEEENARTKSRQLCNGTGVDPVGRCAEIV